MENEKRVVRISRTKKIYLDNVFDTFITPYTPMEIALPWVKKQSPRLSEVLTDKQLIEFINEWQTEQIYE